MLTLQRPLNRDGAPAEATSVRDPNAIDRRTMVVAAVVLLGTIMSTLDTTVINVAIDRLAIDFNASLTTIQWVVTGYTLALAAVIPITGWAADRFGTKRIYLTSVTLFMVGSISCALAWSAGSLIAFRVLQGVGGGMILPAAMTIMTKAAGPERMGRVMGILGVPMLVAPILGPILGGWLVDDVSWRWIFLINVPIGVVAIVLAHLVLDRDRPQPAHKLDWLGMAQLSPGLTALIFGLAESNGSDGFAATKSWLPVAAGAALILGFFWHSLRAEEPLLDIRTFTQTRAGTAAATLMLFAIAFFGALLLIPLYYQTVRGASALEAGLLVAPLGAGAMITMPLAGKLSDRYGPTRWAAVGIPLLVVGMVPFAFVTTTTSRVLLGGATVVLGLGMGLAMMPTMTAAMQAVPETAIARTSTAMNIIRQSGASIGTAILSVVLASAHARAGAPLANAFAHTFVWGLVMLALALIPALAMALGRRKAPADDGPAIQRAEPLRTSEIETTRWRIDPSRSTVAFHTKPFWGLPTVKGRFTRYQGTLDLSGRPAIELTIETDSVDTRNKRRDAHLRSPDFFGAEQHPHVRFVSEGARLHGDRLQIDGRLCAGGRALPLRLNATLRRVGDELEVEAATNADQRRLGMDSRLGVPLSPSRLMIKGRLVPETA